ncbi:MAG: hypothetical protein WDO24_18360 [Pseudomonadota bacterium]
MLEQPNRAEPGFLAPVEPADAPAARLSPSCRFCDHARYTPAPGKVGCQLLSAMTGIQVLRSVDAELHRLWRGRAHPAAYPDAQVIPTDGFADSRVIVAATDRCSRFKPRLSLA